jgi:hypothetical protein
MATEILEPNSCDKTTSGWQACGACSAGSETSTCEATSDCDSGSNVKSGARFHNFDAATKSHSSRSLKFDYKLWANDGDDAASCNTNQLVVEYSLNGGSGWNSWSTVSSGSSNKTGSLSQSISTSQDISQVQVRSYASATSCSPCSGGGGSIWCGFYDSELGRNFCWKVDDCGDCVHSPCPADGCG